MRIWDDNWLLENLGFRVFKHVSNHIKYSKVSTLIDVGLGSWNRRESSPSYPLWRLRKL